ncbi:36810_t:CDS:2, partial [Gigaspora margarita]
NIKRETKEFFENYFSKEGLNRYISSKDWDHWYKPKSQIKSEWFNNLDSPIEDKEWEEMLRDLSTNLVPEHYQSVLAFANDTTWISNSKDQMEKIIELAESFYTLNSIEINNKKSKLVVLNFEKEKQENFLLLNNTKIFAKNKNNITRFLSIWINTQLKKIQ